MVKKEKSKKKTKTIQADKQANYLMFIDTNIFLDFYRNIKKTFEKSMLKHINENKDKIITTDQVLMEYMKNRQGTIIQSLRLIKSPNIDIEIPAFLSGDKIAETISKYKTSLSKAVSHLRNKIINILKNPSTEDPICQCVQKLFREGSNYHLGRHDELRFSIRALAKKRFELGYPPRKKDDTSLGDAINWEWVIKCAKDSNKNIVIVSRDGDYGSTYNGACVLNDWLKQEFFERVGQKQQIILTDKLVDAFKFVGVYVSEEEAKQESEFISKVDRDLNHIKLFNSKYFHESESDLKRFNNNFKILIDNLFDRSDD